MKIIYCALLFSFVLGGVVHCRAQGVIFQGNIINTSRAPLQVVVENLSTGAYLLGSCDTNGNYSVNISSFSINDTVTGYYYNCDSTINDTVFTVSNSPEIVTWNSNYCINFAGPNAIVQGNIIGAGSSVTVVVTSNSDTVAQANADASGNYSVTIPSGYSVGEIECSFINCNLDIIDTVLYVDRNILTWNSNYCLTPKNANATLGGHLFNTNGTIVAIHIQVKDSAMIEDTLLAQTDSVGNYSVTIPYFYFNDSIKCVFTNCKGKSVDTVFVLQDTVNIWNETYCLPVLILCPLSFTASYCPCTNTFYLQLDTTSIPYAHWSLQWNFGEGDTSSLLFPDQSFSARSLYNVCVSLYDSTLTNPVCNFCDSIGFNSTGNLVTRVEGGGGFNVQVIPAGTLQQYVNTPPDSFSLYPNPANSEAGVTIYSGEAAGYPVIITNVLGQQVISTMQNVPAGSSNFNIDVHALTPGAYFMTIRFGYSQVTNMFLKN